jgi:hypothetical protein
MISFGNILFVEAVSGAICAFTWLILNLDLYLTDFLNRTFVGESTKNRASCCGKKRKSIAVYHARVNRDAALRTDRQAFKKALA